MPTYNYPTSAVLKEVEQAKLALLTKDDLSFELFPFVTEDSDTLQWEQLDNFTGVQAARGLNGAPSKVVNTGGKKYQAEVGYYGEFLEIDETEITKRRELGTFAQSMAMEKIISFKQNHLLKREIDRQRLMIWTLLTTGAYTASNGSGQIVHSDSYTFQTANAAVAWATVATATPLADFRAASLLGRGYSANFGRGAKAYMNRKYVNFLLNNANTSVAELGVKKVETGMNVNNLESLNRLLIANDCPEIVAYDEGYFADGSTTQTQFIPDNKVVIIAPRQTGTPVGDICAVRNANNPDGEPGTYSVITDSLTTGNPIPRKIQLHRGWNGGMRVYFPSSICILTV